MSVQAISWVLECSEATLGDRLVMYSVANHCDSSGQSAFPSVATIAKECRLSERQVQRSIQNLQVLGELEVLRGVGIHGTNYFILKKMVRPHCWYCGKDLFLDDRTIDHQTPKSRGGDDDLKNLVYACLPCNLKKSDRTLPEYRTLKNNAKFFAESDEGRQYVTRPTDPRVPNGRQGVTSKPEGVTNGPKIVSQMSPEPSLDPSVTDTNKNGFLSKVESQIKTSEKGSRERFLAKYKQHHRRSA